MSETNRCARWGLLVGARGTMMTAGDRPVTEDDIEGGRALGCNHIRCDSCGARVRQFPARMWSSSLDEAEIARQHDDDDHAANLVQNRFSDKYRAYACRCRIRMQAGVETLDELNLDLDWPWACAGHEP